VKDDTVRRLLALDDEYITAVNEAVAEDRDDLVRELVDSYPDAASRVITNAA
jgi:hypothetical protein